MMSGTWLQTSQTNCMASDRIVPRAKHRCAQLNYEKKNTFTNSVNIKAFVELNQLVLKSSGAELVSSSHVLHGRNVIIFAQFRTVPHRFNVCEQLRRCSPMQKQLFLTVMNRLRMCCDIMISTTAITG